MADNSPKFSFPKKTLFSFMIWFLEKLYGRSQFIKIND